MRMFMLKANQIQHSIKAYQSDMFSSACPENTTGTIGSEHTWEDPDIGRRLQRKDVLQWL